ncbi:6-phospho-beta-glucosidase [Arcanobacterium phocae]|uniref:family 4 glycosyl hydrolase n=1 Tax=Arcanobacterium phocae TaxID=131112 RepID=UPI001C0EA618|nr:6-phospho-beta-glucosidase [Arcanobacterium phocae]
MKLLIVGGGGFRVPQVLSVLSNPQLPLNLTEICLYDVSNARLQTMRNVVKYLGYDHLPPLTLTTDLQEAVKGSDFVFSAMRIGGTCGRVIDEHVALEHGVLGQETVGLGGYAYAFRTIPEALKLAAALRDFAPNAWVINFTNPAGIITQAMRTVHPRVVGICDTPIGLVRRVAHIAGYDENQVDYDYVGLNHLGWLRSITVNGEDHLPAIIADREKLIRLEEARSVGVDWIQAIGKIPNEYLFYYYRNREAVESITGSRTRGEFLDSQQNDFYQNAHEFPSEAGKLWQDAHNEREATYMAESRKEGETRTEEDMSSGGYEHVALDLMLALATGTPTRMILDVANNDGEGILIPELREDAVVEVPCDVDSSGVHPRVVARIDGPELGLITTVKACEELVIEATLRADLQLAWRALASHPLVDSVNVARDILSEYCTKNPSIAQVFSK